MEQERYDRMKRRVSSVRQENQSLRFKLTACLIGMVGLFVVSVVSIATLVVDNYSLRNDLTVASEKYDTLMADNQSLIAENQSLSSTYNDAVLILSDVSEIAYQLDQQNRTLNDDLNDALEKIKQYESREELFDSYEWALFRKDGSRTDISYNDIVTLEELVDEKDLSDDTVDLVLAMAMTESNGNANARNISSSAVGLGQFLSGTGRFVYTSLMGNNAYNHQETASDSETNLEMMVYYLEYLDIKNNHNIERVISCYRGIESPSYKYKINSYLAKNDLSLATIDISTK